MKNKYVPTPAEKKLLQVLLNPEFMGASITKICNQAKVSRNKYYDAMKRPEFLDLVNSTTLDMVKGKAYDVLNATYINALTPKGFQDRKVLLTMAGLYSEKQDIKVQGEINNPFQNLSTDELKKLIKK